MFGFKCGTEHTGSSVGLLQEIARHNLSWLSVLLSQTPFTCVGSHSWCSCHDKSAVLLACDLQEKLSQNAAQATPSRNCYWPKMVLLISPEYRQVVVAEHVSPNHHQTKGKEKEKKSLRC